MSTPCAATRPCAWIVATLSFAALFAASGAVADQPRIGERLYVMIWEHNPGKFSNALRAADEFLRAGKGRQFRIVLDAWGIMAGVRNTTTVQREYVEIRRRNPGLSVSVCKRTADVLRKANKGRPVPYLPGVQVVECAGLRDRLEKEGWRAAIGF